jgi:two-component system cell cycle response regulator DivK
MTKPEAVKAVSGNSLSGKSVLVVEDQADNLEIMRVILRNAGILMIEAHDGLSSLVKFEEHKPDLVVLDVQIPGIDGFEVARWVRKAQPSLPIFIVTSFAFLEYRKRAFDVGCNEYFSKPFSPRLMLTKIKQYLD